MFACNNCGVCHPAAKRQDDCPTCCGGTMTVWMDNQPALWLSRHQPTQKQIEGIVSLGLCLTVVAEGIKLGERNLASEQDAEDLAAAVRALAEKTGAKAIFGVFAAPIQEVLSRYQSYEKNIPCFSAWNTSRSVEGKVPTFEHKKWCLVGGL